MAEYCLTVLRKGWVNISFNGLEHFYFSSIEKLNVFVDEVTKVLGDEMTYERSESSIEFKSIAQDEYNKGSLTLYWQKINWNPPLEDIRRYRMNL